MRFTTLEEIKSTLPKSLFYNYYSQIKCWFLMRGENRSTRGKTSHVQTHSTYDTECGNRTRATLVEGKCSHHWANPLTTRPTLSPQLAYFVFVNFKEIVTYLYAPQFTNNLSNYIHAKS